MTPKGTVFIKVQLPATLHQDMRAIRQARHQLEGADVKLCRIYREAVEQYVRAKPQRQLLAK
jgi:hypothetical protein